jgi:Tfp pilus assembly PilM family ATPase
MPFGLFRSKLSPVLADFGSAGVKLLQTTLGEKPAVAAAGFIPFTDELRAQPLEDRFAFLAKELPLALKEHGFGAGRVVLAPFSQHMLVQHIGVPAADAARADEVVRTQIAIALGCDPAALVVRTSPVCETSRDGQPKSETIAFAMSREDVMRYVELFRRAKCSVVGVHAEIAALVHAFDHVNRRIEDAGTTTMYVDLGYSGTKVAICHGAQMVFAKCIAIGGRTFDARLAELRRLAPADARALRLSEGIRPVRAAAQNAAQNAAPTAASAGATSAPVDAGLAILRAAVARAETDGATPATAVDRRGNGVAPALGASLSGAAQPSVAAEVRETVESLCDELGMCTRYHGALFRDRRIDRVVFLGGEARDVGLCQALAGSLRLPAKAGDPMARYLANGPAPAGLPEPAAAHPGWAVACGLASAPTDL